MRLATLAYVPPPKLPYAEAFLRNIQKHKATHDLVLYSDHAWPDVRVLAGSAEAISGDLDTRGRPKAYSTANLVFYTGMALAERLGYTHILYIEADSRVYGDGWDDAIFAEFFSQRMPMIIGGSVAVHNPSNSGLEGLRRCDELVRRNTRRNFPIPIYGNMGTADRGQSCVFTYGSGTVLDIGWWKKLFSEEERSPEVQSGPVGHQFGMARRPFLDASNGGADGFGMLSISRTSRAWDIEIGMRIWQLFGPDSYDLIAHLGTVFSSFGDVLTTEAERLALLGKEIRFVHQVKSAVDV